MEKTPFFPNGARGEIFGESGGERAVMKFDICQTCLEKHILPLFKDVPKEVADAHPDFERAPTTANHIAANPSDGTRGER